MKRQFQYGPKSKNIQFFFNVDPSIYKKHQPFRKSKRIKTKRMSSDNICEAWDLSNEAMLIGIDEKITSNRCLEDEKSSCSTH